MELYTKTQFRSFTPEQQHSIYLHKLRGVLKTIYRRLERGDFLGAYSNLSNCMEHLAQQYSVNTAVQPIEGTQRQAVSYLSQGQFTETYAVLKHLKQKLKAEGYKYQN